MGIILRNRMVNSYFCQNLFEQDDCYDVESTETNISIFGDIGANDFFNVCLFSYKRPDL